MGSIYLAIDINEESGRHVLGWLEDGKIKLEEVHKFDIKYIDRNDIKLWDLQHIFEQIKTGIARCREIGKLPVLVGLTACDGYFVLLDHEDKVIDDLVFCLDDTAFIENFKNNYAACIEKTKCFLMLSDYFNFLLTGRKACNYTSLLPRKLISLDKKDWDDEHIAKLGFIRTQFPPVSQPGSVIGNLTLKVTDEVGYDFVILQAASRKACAALFNMPDICYDKEEKSYLNSDKANIKEKAKNKSDEPKDNQDERHNDENQNEDNIYNDQIGNKVDGVISDEQKEQKYSASISDELKTAIGCLSILMISGHELKDFEAARECIRESFYITAKKLES